MSAHYDDGGEGDTPSFLFLLSAFLGLNDPLKPEQGSWGTRFVRMPAEFPDGYYSTCGVNVSELERWIPDAKNSFMSRLKWSTQPPSSVNHHPKAAINGDKTNHVRYMTVKPGTEITFDASESSDPDGDKLTFNWFHYREAGTYGGQLKIDDSSSAKLKININVPKDIGTKEIHLVLEVRDNKEPSLVAYKRVVLKGQ